MFHYYWLVRRHSCRSYRRYHLRLPSPSSRNRWVYSESKNSYFNRWDDDPLVKWLCFLIEQFQNLLFEHKDGYFLPKSEENGDFDSEKLQQRWIRLQWLSECVIEKHQIVKGVTRRNSDQQIYCLISRLVQGRRLGIPTRQNGVDDEWSDELDHQKLQDKFFATIGEVFGLFPMGELVSLLAEIERPEVVNFFFMCYHHFVDFDIFHEVLP